MSFISKLENSVENVLRVIAYLLFIGGIIAAWILAYNTSEYSTWSYIGYPEKRFDSFSFIAVGIGGTLASFIIWAGIMFQLNIGINIKRIRKILEERN